MACSNCGATGLHACIGFKPEPWTNEQKARLQTAIDSIKQIKEVDGKGIHSMFNACMHKAECCSKDDEIESLRQQLDESQAREARLREALRAIADLRNLGRITPEVVAFEALALPHDDTALKEYRDAVIDDCIATTNQVLDGLEGADNVADALRVMKGGA